jgi:regulator of protease activity HflC (stomatin/prohibitin superfamily)
MKQQNGFIDPAIALVVVGVIVAAGVIFIGGPQYNVWQQSLAGKAELQKAEYTRQVAVLEAQAKKDSAQQLADAEIIRATGVAKANQIIGDSLKGNPAYLQYLWITQGEENTNRTVYMVPSNGGAPVPTFDIQAPSIPKK